MNPPSFPELANLLKACREAGMSRAKMRLEFCKVVPGAFNDPEATKQKNINIEQRISLYRHFTELLEKWEREALFPDPPEARWNEREQSVIDRHRRDLKAVDRTKGDYLICSNCVTTLAHKSFIETGQLSRCPTCDGYQFVSDRKLIEGRILYLESLTGSEILYESTRFL